MSEQFLPNQLLDQLDEAIDAIIASGEARETAAGEQNLAELFSGN